MGVSKNRGIPKWIVYKFIMENPINMDDLGGFNPYFWVDTHMSHEAVHPSLKFSSCLKEDDITRHQIQRIDLQIYATSIVHAYLGKFRVSMVPMVQQTSVGTWFIRKEDYPMTWFSG